MRDLWATILSHGFGWRDALDMAVVALIVFALIHQVRGTRAVQMLLGVLVLVVGNAAARRLGLITLNRLLDNFLFYMPFAVIVLFQPTIQRALASLGTLLFGRRMAREMTRRACREITKAAFSLATRRHGALVVIERTQGLKNFAESGIYVRGEISADLLTTIFYPGAALHDGAAIIAEGGVLSAGCFLPLTEQPLPMQYGTRHRAAVGITEETDAVSIVVSEERGEVSVAHDGALHGPFTAAALEERLANLLSGGSLADAKIAVPAG